MKNIFVLIMMMFACLISQVYAQFENMENVSLKYWSKANAKMTLKDFEGVIEYCDKCLEIEEDPSCYFLRCKAKYMLKDFKGALQDLKSVENIDGIYYEEVGDLKCMLKDFSGALVSYSKCFDLWGYGSDNLLLSKIGYVRFMLKDYRVAVIEFALLISRDSILAKRYEGTKWDSKISEDCLCIFEDFKNNIENYTYSLPPKIKDFNFNRSERKKTLINFVNILHRNRDLYNFFISQKSGAFDIECFRSIAADLYKAIGFIKGTEDKESVGSIAYAKYVLEDYQGALIDYTAAIISDPNDMNNFYWRAKTKVKLSDIQGAIKDLNTVLEKSTNHDWEVAYFVRGELKDSLKDYEGAVSDFSKAIHNDVKIEFAYEKRGNIECKLNNYRAAIVDYSKSIELDSKRAEVFIGRGLAKNALLDYRGAIADFTNAIAIDPKDASFYNDRALAKYQIKDTNGACLDWSKAGELGNENAYEMIKKYCQ